MVYNPYIVVPAATWAVAQVAKFAIAAMKGQINFRNLYASGGMPSVHSAVVTSLAVTAYLVDGSSSHLFGFVLIFAVIVMYDSLGVRRSSGEQGVVLNLLLENLASNRFKLNAPTPRLRQVLGHQPGEVVVGALTGAVLAGLFNYDRLGWLNDFLTVVPVKRELYAFGAVFAVMIIGGVIARWLLARRYPKSKVMKQFRSQIFVATQTIGWIGLILGVFIYERATYLSWRLWPILALLAGVLWAVGIATSQMRRLRAGLAEEAEQKRKMKWLSPTRKSR